MTGRSAASASCRRKAIRDRAGPITLARFRFGVIAPLLTALPVPGELASSIAALVSRSWPHPTTGEAFQISAKTIERWFYTARDAEQPIEALARKVPSHAGSHPTITAPVIHELGEFRRAHPRWSYRLVHDNLLAITREKPRLGNVPSYTTVCRYMKHNGLAKGRSRAVTSRSPASSRPFFLRTKSATPIGAPAPSPMLLVDPRRGTHLRLFEVAHVHALWHCDFHKARPDRWGSWIRYAQSS